MNNNNNSTFVEYFSYLSFYGSENKLSDVIASTCNISAKFKKLFLDFFFSGSISDYSSEIEREVSVKNVRFDWYFSSGNNEYIIENKIFDINDHFNEYPELIDEKRIGFIANYDVTNIKYTNKHTWEDFYSYLTNKKSNFAEEEQKLIECILVYIKGVCGFMEEKKFSLSNLNDLGYVVQVFKEIMKKKGYEINYKSKCSAEDKMGFWGYDNKKRRSCWFGLYFSANIEDGFSIWGGIYDYEIKEKNINLEYTEFIPDDKTDNCSWFKLKSGYLSKLIKNKDYKNNYEIIKNFIEEVSNM